MQFEISLAHNITKLLHATIMTALVEFQTNVKTYLQVMHIHRSTNFLLHTARTFSNSRILLFENVTNILRNLFPNELSNAYASYSFWKWHYLAVMKNGDWLEIQRTDIPCKMFYKLTLDEKAEFLTLDLSQRGGRPGKLFANRNGRSSCYHSKI